MLGSILNLPRNAKVLRSLSFDPFYNLALEDWLFQNIDFTNNPLVLFSQNSPSVILGSFQNPWKEANIKYLKRNGIKLARRSSGGGTVYHDLGNCNVSILTTKWEYDRKGNLEKICKVLRDNFFISCQVNKKLDIVYEGFKISGTASRIARGKAYHHFTILFSSDVYALTESLQSPLQDIIKTNATPSVPSPVINLSSVNEHLNADSFYSVYSDAVLRECRDACCYEIPADMHEIVIHSHKLSSWDRVYRDTPKFRISINPNIELVIEKGRVTTLEGNASHILEPLLKTRLCYQEFVPKYEEIVENFSECYSENNTLGFNTLIQNLP
ncbi:Lipoyltransferase 1, mitochondrial [Oopsacas minuta]|uniref:Lipoyltransferase 1, mitochondrial n=1 Tax=Oopsacas minuta TaxID=111878 RepID=A0AAV7K1I0_9METZ|nr:Lipoyltransferase 1, mitochondrial [Oopsacas minuta]